MSDATAPGQAAPGTLPQPQLQPQPLDALTFALHGSHLIEASAGTGKTWTIAALYVRWVLGHGTAQTAPVRAMQPPDVLVMTFTRAATRELCDRIRARLMEAAQVFRGVAQTQDAFLSALLADYPDAAAREPAAHRLALAAQSMDDAAVYTIDAWCQRVLREHSLGSGHMGQEQLLADDAALRRQAVQDHWRQQMYPMALAPLQQVLQLWPTAQALDDDLRDLLDKPLPPGPSGSLAQVWADAQQARHAALRGLQQGWAERADALLSWVDAQLQPPLAQGWQTRRLVYDTCQIWLQHLKDWAQVGRGEGAGADATQEAQEALAAATAQLEDKMKTGWSRFTPDGLADCRQPGMGQWDCPPESVAFAQLQTDLAALPHVHQAARLHARSHVLARMAWLKRQNQQFGFAEMLQRLDSALAAPETGPLLAQQLRAQFPVALVDEFQDTSPLQCRIFDRIYGMAHSHDQTALLLIGDPKQSIYGFRGADIHSYLAARVATTGRHHVLDTNFRSTKPLVAAINRWFSVLPDAFGYRTSAGAAAGQGHSDPLPFHPVQARGRADAVCTAQGPVPALTVAHDGQLRSMGDAQTHLAQACAQQVVAWLTDAHVQQDAAPADADADAQSSPPAPKRRRVQPKDIAVLVRKGAEAQAVRDALRVRGVASVYLSERESVFASDQAQDLCLWLRGVCHAHDLACVRAALATRTVGLSLHELHALATQDEVLDAQVQQMHELARTWRVQGVQAMLRQSMHLMQWAAKWRGVADGERCLTNVLHLAELLQMASQTLDGEQALWRWLVHQVSAAHDGQGEGDEAQIVRLESDDDVVKVVTIHKSKGLEYPLVCLPFAHSHRALQPAKTRALPVLPSQAGPDASGQRPWTLDVGANELRQAQTEQLREDLRLWYVALTRARHAVWVGWGAVRQGHGKACVNHLSAAGHLLCGGAQHEAEQWQQLLAALQTDAQGQPLSVRVVPVPAQVPHTRWQPSAQPVALRPARVCTVAIDKAWTVASFSRLTRDAASAEPSLHSPAMHRADWPVAGAIHAADAASANADLPLGVTFAAVSEGLARSAPWHRFVKGPVAGNFLHDQLEWLASDGFVLDEARAARLRVRCERAGHGAQADVLVQWLRCVLAAPLAGPGVALQDVGTVLPEMEFWLPAARLRGARIDALCRQHLLPGVQRPVLPDVQLHGMLMGFADVVFAHQGRYWVLDYKSNHLGPGDAAYGPQALAQAVAQHRYDVQAALYALALHRLLRQRLGADYRPAQHLGGAVYLFLRGIDGPAQGCCTLPMPLALLDGLDAMLNGQEEGA